jgi:uncharacterized coiled-coil DUF342 family protein
MWRDSIEDSSSFTISCAGTKAYLCVFLILNNPANQPMQVTLDIPEDLVTQLNSVREQLPEILKLGLREFNAKGQNGFEGTAEVLEFLAKLPSPDDILALRPSTALQTRIDELLDKQREHGLNPEEERQWQQYQYLEHLVRIAKAGAMLKLKAS